MEKKGCGELGRVFMSYRYSYVRGITNSIDKVEPINEVGGVPQLACGSL